MSIRNPLEWAGDQFRTAGHAVSHAGDYLQRAEPLETRAPTVRTLELADLAAVLRAGLADFAASRSDVLFIGLVYPLAGLALAQAALGGALLPLVFPLASGFALIGPFAATGVYEMSRRMERGETPSWRAAMDVYRSPAFGAIFRLGLLLAGLFGLWLLVAMGLYRLTLGPAMPSSAAAFASAVLTTPEGWMLIMAGTGIGFLFALVVLAVAAVSFPLLLDRRVSVATAVGTSIRVLAYNPVPMLAWGLIVAAALVAGSLPLFLGLIVVMPVLGHATWHLYRRAVA